MGDTMYYLYLFIEAVRPVSYYFDVSVRFDNVCQCYLVVMICRKDSNLWLQYRPRLD